MVTNPTPPNDKFVAPEMEAFPEATSNRTSNPDEAVAASPTTFVKT